MEIDNPGLRIKPEMFVKGRISSAIAADAEEILVPKSAVLWTGKRAVVYVKVREREYPTFLYREIVLGPEAGDFYVVSEGLDEGEEIAVNGVFKIDAAAQLGGLKSMMNPVGGRASTGHDHGSMGAIGRTDPSAVPSMDKESEGYRVPEAFKRQLENVYAGYLRMKDAFVASDAEQVAKMARTMKEALEDVDMELLDEEAHMEWMDQLKVLNSEADRISGISDIEEQRTLFASFNNAFYRSLKSFGLRHGTVYYQYCPMASGDQGAYWFSDIKEIKNPYFGEDMLGCGKTRETLEF